MKAWKTFIESQTTELGTDAVEKWLKTLRIVDFDACNLYLEAKDAFQANWFEEHIKPKVHKLLINNNRKRIKVHLSLANDVAKPVRLKKGKKPPKVIEEKFHLNFDPLDSLCTLSNFVVSPSNFLTYKVISQLAKSESTNDAMPLNNLNPIYLCGNVGAGKTHLLMAAAALFREQGKHVIFSRAQTFTDHLVSAIRAGEISQFRQLYRNTDLLMIDDVHLFSRKGATQEELFHTFNTLHTAGKQIILGADCHPNELQHIEPRLVSRFEWGIVLSLEAPNRMESIEILKAKAITMEYPIHPKVIEFLVDTFSSTNSIIKAFKALILRSHLNKEEGKDKVILSVPVVRQLLSDLIIEEERSRLTPERIVQGVAEFFGLRSEDILGKAQTRECVLSRQISMHLCRYQLKMPYMKIGELFNKDHSTVISSAKVIQKGLDSDDDQIATPYRLILKKIKTHASEI